MLNFTDWGYAGLFIASFLAATVVPFSSEVVFSAMVFGGLHPWTCVLVATAGNWLGGMTSYYIGRLGKIEWAEKFLHISKDKIERFVGKFSRYGDWFVFFSVIASPANSDIPHFLQIQHTIRVFGPPGELKSAQGNIRALFTGVGQRPAGLGNEIPASVLRNDHQKLCWS